LKACHQQCSEFEDPEYHKGQHQVGYSIEHSVPQDQAHEIFMKQIADQQTDKAHAEEEDLVVQTEFFLL
jgi:hypothetical protein